MAKFTNDNDCGQWNSSIVEDLRSDEHFLSTAETLHVSALDHCFDGESPVSDGLEVLGVKFLSGVLISVEFQLWLFTKGGMGHSVSPARFSVEVVGRNEHIATFGFGLRDTKGNFMYPRDDKDYGKYDSPPDKTDGWAFWRSRQFGDSSLSGWRKRQTDGSA